MSIVIIARHGDTFAPGETVRRIGARTDLPLVASGRVQAERMRAAFAADGLVFDRAWTSPLRRTRETAAIVLADSGVPAATGAWLTEIDHGPDEGAPEAAVIARLGAAVLAEWDRDARAPVGWIVDNAARAAAWRAVLDKLARTDACALMMTSNGAARFAFTHSDLASAPADLPSLKLRTGAWGKLVHEPAGWRIDDWDRRP